MEPYETFEHEGITVEIHYDEDGGMHDSPRDYDNVTTMVCWHPDYALGDEQFRAPDGRGHVVTPFHEGREGVCSMQQLERYLRIVRKAVGIRPLYLLDHSGLAIRAGSGFAEDSAGWDTTMVGFVYTTHERINELCGEDERFHTDEWIDEAITADVKDYDYHLKGCYYGYIVAPGSRDEDSCWGFLGYPEESGCIEEAKASAAYIAKERREQRALPWLPTFGNPIQKAVTT